MLRALLRTLLAAPLTAPLLALLALAPAATHAQPPPPASPTPPATPPAIAPPTSPHDAPQATPLAETGRHLLQKLGCTGCHTLDGRPSVGPTFADRWGGLTAVTHAGAQASTPTPYDRAYLTRALHAPDAEITHGFAPGIMPAYPLTAPDIDALAAALAAAATDAPDPPPTTWSWLIIGAILFTLGHFALSAHPLRAHLVTRLGEGPFSALYSLIALAGIGLLFYGHTTAPYLELWPKHPATYDIPLYTMPLALLLWVFGFTTPSPTAVAQGQLAARAPTGITTITRHPALWGFVLWSLAHLAPNGDLASLMLFASFTLLALGGMWHIDRRRARALGETWHAYAATTSVIPFAAALTGRTRLRFTRADLIRLAATALLFVALLHTHHHLFGVPARLP